MTSLPLFTTLLLIFGHLTSAYVIKQERTKRNYGSSYQSPLLEGLGYGNVDGSYGRNLFPDTNDFNDGYLHSGFQDFQGFGNVDGSYGRNPFPDIHDFNDGYGSSGGNRFQDFHGLDPSNDPVFQNILRDLRRGNPLHSQFDFNSDFVPSLRARIAAAGSAQLIDRMKTYCPSCVATREDLDHEQSPSPSPPGTIVA